MSVLDIPTDRPRLAGAVLLAAQAEEQSGRWAGPELAYVQGVADTLAWLTGDVTGNVFRGGPLSGFESGDVLAQAAGA